MTNLKAKGDKYRYRTAEEGKAVEVEVSYSKGGTNYFSGGTSPRGIYVRITPVTLEHGCVSFKLFSGTGMCLVHLLRKSDKQLLAVAERLDAVVPDAATMFEHNNKESALALLRDAFNPSAVTTAVTQ